LEVLGREREREREREIESKRHNEEAASTVRTKKKEETNERTHHRRRQKKNNLWSCFVLLSARAALSLAVLLLAEAHLVGDFDHGGSQVLVQGSAVLGLVVGMSHLDGAFQVDEAAAGAALRLLATRLGASVAAQVAFGLGAGRRLLA
jgi:hypothetical protein